MEPVITDCIKACVSSDFCNALIWKAFCISMPTPGFDKSPTCCIMQMNVQLSLLQASALTWWDEEVAYRKPAAAALAGLAQGTGLLHSSWTAQPK